MGFKDMAMDDLNKVFFNIDEFAEECTWNKTKIVAVVDDDSLIRKYSAEFSSLSQGSHLIYVAENQFTKAPFINEVVVFNNNTYTVDEVKRELGMLAIFLDCGRG
jgi:hypothetical protein